MVCESRKFFVFSLKVVLNVFTVIMETQIKRIHFDVGTYESNGIFFPRITSFRINSAENRIQNIS